MTCGSNECFFIKYLKITIRFRRSPPIDGPTKSSVSAIQLVLTRLVCMCMVSETNNGIEVWEMIDRSADSDGLVGPELS